MLRPTSSTRHSHLHLITFHHRHATRHDTTRQANFFLENMIDLADKELDDRVVQHLMKDPEEDGGQWSMAANLVEKYGLVPQTSQSALFVRTKTPSLTMRNEQSIPNRSIRPQRPNSTDC